MLLEAVGGTSLLDAVGGTSLLEAVGGTSVLKAADVSSFLEAVDGSSLLEVEVSSLLEAADNVHNLVLYAFFVFPRVTTIVSNGNCARFHRTALFE